MNQIPGHWTWNRPAKETAVRRIDLGIPVKIIKIFQACSLFFLEVFILLNYNRTYYSSR